MRSSADGFSFARDSGMFPDRNDHQFSRAARYESFPIAMLHTYLKVACGKEIRLEIIDLEIPKRHPILKFHNAPKNAKCVTRKRLYLTKMPNQLFCLIKYAILDS